MIEQCLAVAVEAARESGHFLRRNFQDPAQLRVNEATRHDIKLEMDVRSQAMITDRLLGAFPDHALFGEEGVAGNQASEWQWIVDPIDGTVNYFYGIPHFAVSIALRRGDELQAGVIYDPMVDELWTVTKEGPAQLNGRTIAVSERAEMPEAVVSVGFSKTVAGMEQGCDSFVKLAFQVRKIRMFGSAALGMAWVAGGRLDAYVEEALSLWDIAAGVLLIQRAGGAVDLLAAEDDPNRFRVRATNGKLKLGLPD